MTNQKTEHLPHLVSYVIRPALTEAKLMTRKHARDTVYVATLTEELCGIDAKLAELEKDMQLSTSTQPMTVSPLAAAPEPPDADWIHAKSAELEARLHRIERSSAAKPWTGAKNPKK